MKSIWLWYLPLLFFPNIGFAGATGFGTLEFSDLLIGPYIILLLFVTDWKSKLTIGRSTPLMMLFVGWALLSTATIPVRYNEPTDYFLVFGTLKIAKMVLYGVAGILTARALFRLSKPEAYDWSLLGAAVVNGLALWVTQLGILNDTNGNAGYSATNGISVMAALLLCYLGGQLVTTRGTRRWRSVAPWGLAILIAGMAVSDGRGGWIAALLGSIYIALRLGFRRQVLTYAVAGLAVVSTLYVVQPDFHDQIHKTFFPPETTSGYQGTRNIGNVDDGGRFENWTHEARKLSNAPLMGTGMFHRGGDSGLLATGSHNFWLQMYLELGLVGGSLVIAVFVGMWRHASKLNMSSSFEDVPLKAALVAALVGGLGGEYFYGGIILLSLFMIYAPAGALAYRRSIRPTHGNSHAFESSDWIPITRTQSHAK